MTNLLNLSLDHLVANVLGIGVCLIIMFVCICRLNVSKTMRLRVSMTQLMLICFAFWAASTARELFLGEDIGLHNAAVGLGILLYLAVTYRQWMVEEALAQEAYEREMSGFGQGSILARVEGDDDARRSG